MLTLHRLKESFFVAEGGKVKELRGAARMDWLEGLTPGTEILLTQAGGPDAVVLSLSEKGVKLFSIHWHRAGVEKGLKPGEIALAFSAIERGLLSEFVPRRELFNLRYVVDARRAVVNLRRSGELQMKQMQRHWLVREEDDQPEILEEFGKDIARVKKEEEGPINKKIAELCRQIPECLVFNAVAGIDSGSQLAAVFTAYCAPLGRWHSVAALWKNCRLDVQEGRAPKRKKGVASTGNPKMGEAWYQLSEVIVKNRANPWRAVYDRHREFELAHHERKHPGCKTPIRHCGMMARRKVVKEILKQWFITVCHPKSANQPGYADSDLVMV